MKELLFKLDLGHYIQAVSIDKTPFICDVKESLDNMYSQKWKNMLSREVGINGKGGNKLRTYRRFKHDFTPACYVTTIIPKAHRSAVAQLRCGTAPLHIETGI